MRIFLIFVLLSTLVWAQPDPPSSSEHEAGFLFRQGLKLMEEHQTVRATEMLREALRLEPERLEIRPYLARALYDGGDYQGSLRQSEVYLEAEPTDAKVGLLRVRALAALERYGQASDALELLRGAQADAWEWHNLRGFVHQQQGDLEAAEASFQRATELAGSGVFEPRTNLISLWLSQDRVDEAATLSRTMLAEAADDARVLNAFALVLSRQEPGFDPAPILEALKSQQPPLELQYNLAAVLAERGETAEAALLAADLVDRFPTDPRASWIYGRVLLQQRELQDAGEYLLSSYEKLPIDDEILQTLAAYSYLVGNFEEAVSWYGQAVGRRPNDASLLHNLSLALDRVDRLEEALKESEHAIALDGDEPSYVYHYAKLLERSSRASEAQAQYQRYLDITNDAETAAIVRDHLAELKK